MFRMPFHAKTETVRGGFNAFNHAIGCGGIDDYILTNILNRLMMIAIHLHQGGACDAVQERICRDGDGVPWLIARGWLLMFQCIGNGIRDMLMERATKDNI